MVLKNGLMTTLCIFAMKLSTLYIMMNICGREEQQLTKNYLSRVITYNRLLEILETLNPNIKELKILKVERCKNNKDTITYLFYIGVIIYEVELRYFDDINEIIQIALNTVDTITNNFATVRKFDKYN